MALLNVGATTMPRLGPMARTELQAETRAGADLPKANKYSRRTQLWDYYTTAITILLTITITTTITITVTTGIRLFLCL